MKGGKLAMEKVNNTTETHSYYAGLYYECSCGNEYGYFVPTSKGSSVGLKPVFVSESRLDDILKQISSRDY